MVSIEDVFNWEIPFINISVLDFMIAVIVTVIVALVLMMVVLKVLRAAMNKAGLPPLLSGLLTRVVRVMLMLVILLIFLSMIGFDVSSLVLALAAIFGLILAFGMSDSTNNFFAGIWLATIRPFRMGEVVDVAGQTGKVMGVGIMVTELLKPDNVFIIIPNRKVWGETIVNYSRMPNRRVNTDVGIAYGSDVQKAYDVAMRIMNEHPKVLDDPAPSIYMTALADSSVNLQLRPWARNEDYWDVLHDMRRSLHNELPKAGINIPFPQLDVHMIGSDPTPAGY